MDARWLALLVPVLGAAAASGRGGSGLRSALPKRRPSYSITFERVSPPEGDDEEGEVARGWIQSGGHELEVPSELYGDAVRKFIEDAGGVTFYVDEEFSYDPEDGVGFAETMARVLRNAGATDPSSSPFSPGSWWMTHGEQNYRTGDTTTLSYHLNGFSPEEEISIARLLGKQIDPRHQGSSQRRGSKSGKSVRQRQDEAARAYGETRNPDSVGFILSDGRWIDFSEGTHGTRTLDHRNVGHLLSEAQEIPQHEYASSTRNMNRWMDLAHAVRVSSSGRRDDRYVLVDLPDDPEALRDVLSPAGRRSIFRYLQGANSATVGVPGGGRREVDPYTPGGLAEVFDEVLSGGQANRRRGSGLKAVLPKVQVVAPAISCELTVFWSGLSGSLKIRTPWQKPSEKALWEPEYLMTLENMSLFLKSAVKLYDGLMDELKSEPVVLDLLEGRQPTHSVSVTFAFDLPVKIQIHDDRTLILGPAPVFWGTASEDLVVKELKHNVKISSASVPSSMSARPEELRRKAIQHRTKKALEYLEGRLSRGDLSNVPVSVWL